jgi:hypothetical protein
MAGAYFALPGGWLYERLQQHPLGGPRYETRVFLSGHIAIRVPVQSHMYLWELPGALPAMHMSCWLYVLMWQLVRCTIIVMHSISCRLQIE